MENSSRSQSDLRTDIGPFSIVPEWVLDSEISHGAVRLYALLARYTNSDHAAWPSRATLATRLRTSKDSVDRWIKELGCVQALHVEHRREVTKEGNLINRSNLYTLAVVPPGVGAPVRPPSRMDAATGSRTVAAQNDNQLEREPVKNLFDSFWNAYDKKVGRKTSLLQWSKQVPDVATAEKAIAAARQQAKTVDRQYRKDPERWLRDHRWNDSAVLEPSGSAGTIARLRAKVERGEV
jgi:hypothetical protein